jgi:hypothetical protein
MKFAYSGIHLVWSLLKRMTHNSSLWDCITVASSSITAIEEYGRTFQKRYASEFKGDNRRKTPCIIYEPVPIKSEYCQ